METSYFLLYKSPISIFDTRHEFRSLVQERYLIPVGVIVPVGVKGVSSELYGVLIRSPSIINT